ncbi:g5828 [Coccomyxa elongata]
MAEMSAEAGTKTLWMGDLAYWMDESFVYSIFVGTGQLVSVKIIRNKNTAVSEGYGFVEFATHEAAEQVLRTFNGCPIPNTDQIFRLNWAAFGVGKVTTDSDFSVFVGDLAPDVTDYALQEHFRQFFASVRSAKVITDPLTGRSKGYGFVRFGNEAERDRSLTEMSGHVINSRPIRVSIATAKKSQTAALGTPSPVASQPHPSDYDPNNTTLFIGGLSSGVSEDDLRVLFGRFGDIVYTKIPPGKGCGFVQFVQRPAAETAMAQMQGQVLGGSTIRISWGRSSTSRAAVNAAAAAPYPGAFPVAAAGYGAAGAAAYGIGAFDANGYGSFGAAPAAPTATSDPYSAYYAAAVSNPEAALYTGFGSGGLGGLPGATFGAGLGLPTASKDAFDPLAPIDVDKLNAAFISRHQAALLGSHLRA